MTTQGATVPGFGVGHWTDPEGRTGCTVVVPEARSLAVAEVRGGAPGTREMALLEEGRLVQRVDAVLLTGGSAFGLTAAEGVVRWLRERGRGFPTESIPVPIVPAAVLYDLEGSDPIWPTESAGYAAAASASPDGWRSGRIGAGTGARVGRAFGAAASPGGLGCAVVASPAGAVGAVVAVNAIGTVVEPRGSAVVAGGLALEGGPPLDAETVLLQGGQVSPREGQSTTLAVVAIDAALDRDALRRLVVAAHAGIARAIRPAHTLFDGDVVFALARREGAVDPVALLQLSVAATQAVASAIVNAVRGG